MSSAVVVVVTRFGNVDLLIEGCLSCHPRDDDTLKELPLSHRLAMICGTSTCHITVSLSLCLTSNYNVCSLYCVYVNK